MIVKEFVLFLKYISYKYSLHRNGCLHIFSLSHSPLEGLTTSFFILLMNDILYAQTMGHAVSACQECFHKFMIYTLGIHGRVLVYLRWGSVLWLPWLVTQQECVFVTSTLMPALERRTPLAFPEKRHLTCISAVHN